MAKTENLNIRIEPNLKKQAEETLSYLGLTMSEAITMFFKQIVINDGIPFPIQAKPYSMKTRKAMKEAAKLAKQPDKAKKYSNFNELWEDLD